MNFEGPEKLGILSQILDYLVSERNWNWSRRRDINEMSLISEKKTYSKEDAIDIDKKVHQ